MRAIDVIHRSGVAIAPDRTIREAAEIMEQSGVGTLAIIEDGKLLGIVTDRDLVRRALARGLASDSRIDGVMTTPVVTIEADVDVREAFAMFRSHGLRRVVVVRDGVFQGTVSIDDLLVLVSAELDDLCRPVTAEMLFAHRESGLPATVN